MLIAILSFAFLSVIAVVGAITHFGFGYDLSKLCFIIPVCSISFFLAWSMIFMFLDDIFPDLKSKRNTDER